MLKLRKLTRAARHFGHRLSFLFLFYRLFHFTRYADLSQGALRLGSLRSGRYSVRDARQILFCDSVRLAFICTILSDEQNQ